MSFSKLFLCPLVGMILMQNNFFDIVSFVVTNFMVSFVLTRYGSKLGICPLRMFRIWLVALFFLSDRICII